jgi:hypothetical protein
MDSEAGNRIDLSDEQQSNANDFISFSFDPDANVNDFSDFISLRAEQESRTRDAGRQSDSNWSHPANAWDPIFDKSDWGSNIRADKLVHSKKHFSLRDCVLLGIEIDCNDEQPENASSSI